MTKTKAGIPAETCPDCGTLISVIRSRKRKIKTSCAGVTVTRDWDDQAQDWVTKICGRKFTFEPEPDPEPEPVPGF